MEKFIHPKGRNSKACTLGLLIAVLLLLAHIYLNNVSVQPPPVKIYNQLNEPVEVSKEEVELQQQGHKVKISEDGFVLDVKFVEDNLYSLDQRDKQLIQYTRIRHLTPPSKLPYNLETAGNYKDEFSGWVANFFQNKTNGIFIEAGAHEGEKGSHTLYLEKELGWTGLLVECNPTVIPYLVSHHRKSWVASICLAPSTTPGTFNFSNPTNWTYSGTFKKPWNLPVPTKWTFFDVETMPLYTVLAALGWKEIDYFSFDIEGSELGVLKTFPFEEIIFKVLVVEVMFYTPDEKQELDNLIRSKGYHFVRNMQVDKIYVHESVKHLLKE